MAMFSRLAQKPSRTTDPVLTKSWPTAVTANGISGSKQLLGAEGSTTTQYLASQGLPMPSPSSSSWVGLATLKQLSATLRTPSLSLSLSQESPIPSPSVSTCPGLATAGQLSKSSPTASPSLSTLQTPVEGST